MGYKEIELKIPLILSNRELKEFIRNETGLKDFSYQILRKSLDARNKRKIHWQYKLGISSVELRNGQLPEFLSIEIQQKNYSSRALVVGSGPAGVFCALVLSEAGMNVTLIEQGGQVEERKKLIDKFELNGEFDATSNYAFGEGGAGTFSDGKLTSRTKGISRERNYIFQAFADAGAPDEIMYMTHPHLGSDNLVNITHNLRKRFLGQGGNILFHTKLEDIRISNGHVVKAITNCGELEAEHFIIAPGHSSYETYKMLLGCGIPFQTKNFAIGMRAEHPQELINIAQWGTHKLPGVKAAEYRLTAKDKALRPIYTFCMCPGGIVVPATPYKHTNIVNGMSLYERNNRWANAAVVAGIHPDELIGKKSTPIEAIDYLEGLEHSFFAYSNSFNAPAINIKDFIEGKTSQNLPKSSYPFNLLSAKMEELLPLQIVDALKQGLQLFSNKLSGYEKGTLIGLESKTSSPIQVVRDRETYSSGYKNLYLTGEGSGWAGGIISSAADGVKVALSILNRAK